MGGADYETLEWAAHLDNFLDALEDYQETRADLKKAAENAGGSWADFGYYHSHDYDQMERAKKRIHDSLTKLLGAAHE